MDKFKILQEFESFYDAMKPAQEKSAESFVWFTGMPHPLFNAVMHLKTSGNLDAKVDALIAQANGDFPISFWIHDQHESLTLLEILSKRGFQRLIRCPLMSWSIKPLDPPKKEIQLAEVDIFHNILSTAFHFDRSVKEGFERLLANIEIENYLIHKDGQPVGTGSLMPKGKIGGIFNLATLPEFQKRGCGRAMMHYLMHRSSVLGQEKLLLLSSPVAEKLYLDLGFTKCLDIEIYAF